MVGPSDFRLTRRNLMKAGALGLGMAAIPGLSACTSGTPGESGSSGSVPTVELGSEVTSGGPTFPEGYLGPRITERKPFGDGSKTFRVVVPQDSTIVGDWNANKMTAWFEKFTGVKVQFDAVLMTAPDGTTDMTKINAMLAGGDLPDAFLGIPFTTDAAVALRPAGSLRLARRLHRHLAPTAAPGHDRLPRPEEGSSPPPTARSTRSPGSTTASTAAVSPGRAWISQVVPGQGRHADPEHHRRAAPGAPGFQGEEPHRQVRHSCRSLPASATRSTAAS